MCDGAALHLVVDIRWHVGLDRHLIGRFIWQPDLLGELLFWNTDAGPEEICLGRLSQHG